MNRFKVVTVGNAQAGKTCLLHRLLSDRFLPNYLSTIGIDWFSKTLYVDDARGEDSAPSDLASDDPLMGRPDTVPTKREVTLTLWDTGGQERFQSLASSYTKDCAAALLVFDLTDLASLQALSTWAELARRGNEDIRLYLVGNKSDLPRAVKGHQIDAMAEQLGCQPDAVWTCSAKTGSQVLELFQAVGKDLLERSEHVARLARAGGAQGLAAQYRIGTPATIDLTAPPAAQDALAGVTGTSRWTCGC